MDEYSSRIEQLLVESKWEAAASECDRLIESGIDEAELHVFKLMAETKSHTRTDLSYAKLPFDDSYDFKRACELDKDVKEELEKCLENVKTRIENERKDKVYATACGMAEVSLEESVIKASIKQLKSIGEWKDAPDRIEEFEAKIKKLKKKSKKKEAADKEVERLEKQIYNQKKRKRFFWIIILIMFISCGVFAITPAGSYVGGMALMETENYGLAETLFKRTDGFSDSKQKIVECVYHIGIAHEQNGNYKKGIKEFESISTYEDSAQHVIECRYQRGIQLWEDNKYAEAVEELARVNNYKKADEYLQLCESAQLENVHVGDEVSMGAFEQDGNKSNGKEAVTWVVVSKDGNGIVLMTRKCLSGIAFSQEDSTWEDSNLRTWLNDKFLNTAFTNREQQLLTPVKHGTQTDMVYIISGKELSSAIPLSSDRKAKATTKASKAGLYMDGENYAYYWLRSASINGHASAVSSDGRILENGVSSSTKTTGVRPVVRINVVEQKNDVYQD